MLKDFSQSDMSNLKVHGQAEGNLTPYERKLQKDIDKLTGVWGRFQVVHD